MARLSSILGETPDQPVEDRERLRRASAFLSTLGRRRVERIAAEMTLPRQVDEVVCRHLLERLGLEQVRRNALAHRGERSRWARIAALRVLAVGKPDHAWAALEKALLDRDREVVGAAVTVLGNMADLRAADLLVRALRVGCYPGSRVSSFLDRFALDVSALVRPLLKHPGATARYWSALLFRRYPSAGGAAGELARMAADEEPLVRRAAIESLAATGGPEAVEAARAGLDDDVWFVRAHAARALGVLGDLEAAPRVAHLLADREWWVRYAAKVGLEAMGEPVVPDLLPLLTHPDAFARNGAAEVLQNLGAFERLLTEEASAGALGGRQAQLEVLAHAGGVRMSDAALDRLAPDVRERAARILDSLGVEQAGVAGGAR